VYCSSVFYLVSDLYVCCRVVENVIKRMEAIYGPSILPIEGRKATSFRCLYFPTLSSSMFNICLYAIIHLAVERMQGKNEATARFEARFDKETAKYFDPISIRLPKSPSPQPQPLPLPRARRNKADRKDGKEACILCIRI